MLLLVSWRNDVLGHPTTSLQQLAYVALVTLFVLHPPIIVATFARFAAVPPHQLAPSSNLTAFSAETLAVWRRCISNSARDLLYEQVVI
jgi:hypothetical protein